MKKMYVYPQTGVIAIEAETGVMLLPSNTGPETAPAMRSNAPLTF